MPSFVF